MDQVGLRPRPSRSRRPATGVPPRRLRRSRPSIRGGSVRRANTVPASRSWKLCARASVARFGSVRCRVNMSGTVRCAVRRSNPVVCTTPAGTSVLRPPRLTRPRAFPRMGSRGVEQRQLVGLITRRSAVRIRPPQPSLYLNPGSDRPGFFLAVNGCRDGTTLDGVGRCAPRSGPFLRPRFAGLGARARSLRCSRPPASVAPSRRMPSRGRFGRRLSRLSRLAITTRRIWAHGRSEMAFPWPVSGLRPRMISPGGGPVRGDG